MKKTIGVMFPGFGEQFIGMGKKLYDESRNVQDLFEQASMCFDLNFVQLCFAGSYSDILDIDKGYLLILLIEISIYSELTKAGLRPDFIAGYGIGEYAAAVASGSLNFSDGMYIIGKYAKIFKEFIAEHPHYSVLQIPRKFTQESILNLCAAFSTENKKVFVAAYNTQEGFTIAGDADAIAKIKEYCKEHEIRKIKELNIAYGLHSSIMNPIVEKITPYFFKVDFKPLKTPVITNVDGVYVTSSDALESAIIRRVNEPLLWDEVMNGFIGCDVLLSVGPGKQLADWARLKYPDKEIYTIEDWADLQALRPFLQEHAQAQGIIQEEVGITFGTCHVDTDESLLPDLTTADLVNELPADYDIDEDDDIQ